MVEIDDSEIKEINKNPWTSLGVASLLAVMFGYLIIWILSFLSILILGFEYTSVLYENLFGNISGRFKIDFRVHTLDEKVYMILLSFLHGMLLNPLRRMFFSSVRGIIKKNLS